MVINKENGLLTNKIYIYYIFDISVMSEKEKMNY